MFFEEYFQKRGEEVTPNSQNEVQVKCPFPHAKGLEEHASASFNVKRRIYKCFACAAEGLDDGMSETSFIGKLYHVDYETAIKLKNMHMEAVNLEQMTDNLMNNPSLVKYLSDRGIPEQAIIEYQLGYTGDGIIYPVLLDGILFDTRTHVPNPAEGEPKTRSRKKAKPLLFPYDHWKKDSKPTIMTAGENDTLLGRTFGFNCVETTLGEGSIPIILKVFYGKTVYVCYDCDHAGKAAASKLAFYLKEAGASDVYIISLGLEGTKADKDLTDYFVKHKKTAEDFQQLVDTAELFTQEQYIEEKNKEFQLVDLWNVKSSHYTNKYISSRVMQSGHFEIPLVDVPSHLDWECLGAMDNPACNICSFYGGATGTWTLDNNNLEDILGLLEVNVATRNKYMKSLCGLPAKCPNSRIRPIAYKHVEKVILAPDVETENEATGYRAAELFAYILDGNTEDGNKYRMYFKRVADLKTGSMVLIVDKVEDSDNAINSFKVTPQFMQAMKQWQGNPYTIMKKRYEDLGKVAVGKYLPEMIFYASDIVYHSVLDFKLFGKEEKGHPEGLIIGASRTGKSEVGNAMQRFYGLGNVTEAKNASVAGLIGGVDKSTNGTYRISWGSIPRNHKGMLFMDEISGLPPEVFKHLTGLRSQRKAVIEKIRKGEAPAKTRLLWVGNPRVGEDKRSRSLYDYNYGVDVCLDLFPADEDISRFDFIILVPEPAEYISPLNPDGTVPEKAQLPKELKDLVRWVWSRSVDQVVFEPYVERYIEQTALDLDKDFGSSVKIIGVEGGKKIARIATSVAACCFSCSEDGEKVIVKKEHVDWVKDFLLKCYDNEIFRLKQYVVEERKFITTDDETTVYVAGLIKKYPMLMKVLIEQQDCPHYNLKAASAIDDTEYKFITSNMMMKGLIKPTPKGVVATRKLRLSVDILRAKKPVKMKEKPIEDSSPRSFSDKMKFK